IKDIAKIMTNKNRSSAPFWTIAALAIVGSVSAFAYAGVLLFPDRPAGFPSRQTIDAPAHRVHRLRSPVHFERTSGPGV
ncbi:MAG TPA: hypothetical protein VM925_21910, partial [Labilithrix sp.]|nr:hypothetical protein [Labilithrix sp.]